MIIVLIEKKSSLTDFGPYLADKEIDIVSAMQRIDNNSIGLVYIVDGSNRLVGCLTDGDIRRWLIKTGDLSAKASQAMNAQPRFLFEKDRAEARQRMEGDGIFSIAILNNKKQIVDVIIHDSKIKFKKSTKTDALSSVSVVIMAGGKGTRLYPYTKILPKPLIPVGDVPIIERILDRLYNSGASEFYLSVNYKREMIKSYFADVDKPYKIKYIEEERPLGTAGSIKIIEKELRPQLLVSNCDILIDVDYCDLIRHHGISENDMTIVSSMKNTTIPYGVLHTVENGVVSSMEEKPIYSSFINTGMYLLNSEYISMIPYEKMFHMTDLAQLMIDKGKQVGMYPISENSFLDMGEFSEMKRMERYLSE